MEQFKISNLLSFDNLKLKENINGHREKLCKLNIIVINLS